MDTPTESTIKFEAHLQAIENTVQNAALDGGCNFSDHVIYHCEMIRALYEALEDDNKSVVNLSAVRDYTGAPYIDKSVGEKI